MADTTRTYRISRDGEPLDDFSTTDSPLLALVRVVESVVTLSNATFVSHMKGGFATATVALYGPGASATTFTATLAEEQQPELRPKGVRPTDPRKLVAEQAARLGLDPADERDAEMLRRLLAVIISRPVTKEKPIRPADATGSLPALKRVAELHESGKDWLDFIAFVKTNELAILSKPEYDTAYGEWTSMLEATGQTAAAEGDYA